LADSRRRLQPSLSLTLILQFLTPNLSASLITPSIHLRFGLPARLLPSGLSKLIFLHGRLSCVRTICLSHLNCCYQVSPIVQTIQFFILLNIFLSKIPRRHSSALLRTQFSAPYIGTDFINVLYMVTLCFLFMCLAFSNTIICGVKIVLYKSVISDNDRF